MRADSIQILQQKSGSWEGELCSPLLWQNTELEVDIPDDF